jgi:hypothetical protein
MWQSFEVELCMEECKCDFVLKCIMYNSIQLTLGVRQTFLNLRVTIPPCEHVYKKQQTKIPF